MRVENGITKLNLGCGEFPKEGYLNVDLHAVSEPDLRHDLNSLPYPFPEDRFSLIELDHVMEHLNDPFAVMRELYRIARDGATIKIRVPHCSRGFTHPQHKAGFDVSFPLYFDPSFQGGFQGITLRLDAMKLRWFAQPHLKKTVLPGPVFHGARVAGALMDRLANLSPYLCSRLWCSWVGGFEEIQYRFTVIKDSGAS